MSNGDTKTIYYSPEAVSDFIDDVVLKAFIIDAPGVFLGAAQKNEAGKANATTCTFTLPLHVTAASTPSGMPDRIPPREITTFKATYDGPDLTTKNVWFSIVGNSQANGEPRMHWDGDSKYYTAWRITTPKDYDMPLTTRPSPEDESDPGQTDWQSPNKLFLKVTVTTPDDPLQMVGAKLDDKLVRGITTSDPFNVSAIPISTVATVQKVIFTLTDGIIETGVRYEMTFKSDSKRMEDLDEIWISEKVDQPVTTGEFEKQGIVVGGFNPFVTIAGGLKYTTFIDTISSTWPSGGGANDADRKEAYYTSRLLAYLRNENIFKTGRSIFAVNQHQVFYDRRSGGNPNSYFAVKNSGFAISMEIRKRAKGGGIEYVVIRTPKAIGNVEAGSLADGEPETTRVW